MTERLKEPTPTDIIVEEIDRKIFGTERFIEPFPVRKPQLALKGEKAIDIPARKVSQKELYGTLPAERLHATRVWNKVRPLASKSRLTQLGKIKAKEDPHKITGR